jgi:hypothetical protein
MSFVTLHPGFETEAGAANQAQRVASLAGAHVGLLDNNKKSVGTFLTMVEEILTGQFGVRKVTRVTKSNASVPVPDDAIAALDGIDVLITGIGD